MAKSYGPGRNRGMDKVVKWMDYLMAMTSKQLPASALHIRPRRGGGFAGERLQMLHPKVIHTISHHPLMSKLFPVVIGFFPKADGHFVVREEGIDDYIFIVCLNGMGFLELGGRRLEITPGTVLLIPPGEPHSYGADEKAPWSILWVHLRGSDCEQVAKLLDLSLDEPRLHLPALAQFRNEFEQTLGALKNAQSIPQLAFVCAHLQRLFSFVALHRQSVNQRSRTAEEAITASPGWMREHLSEPLSLAQLARAAMLSPSHYSSLFRKRFGCAPVEFLIRMKVEESCHLLDQTNETITEIANRIGYEDAYYFSRIFKKITGMAPSQYRQLPKG